MFKWISVGWRLADSTENADLNKNLIVAEKNSLLHNLLRDTDDQAKTVIVIWSLTGQLKLRMLIWTLRRQLLIPSGRQPGLP